MSSVFLSYAHTDSQIVNKIANDLQKEGIRVWLDRRDLLAGQDWQNQIEKAITEAGFALVFISAESLKSKWVQEEYRAAFVHQQKTGGTRLIPILLQKVVLPEFLSTIQYVDFTESYDNGMQNLMRALKTSSGVKPKDVIPVSDLAKEVAGEVAKILGLETKTYPIKLPNPIDPKLVFVIAPFRDDMEPIFEGIKVAGNSIGLNVKRVKDVIGDYRITDQIIQMINSASLIVADL